MELILRAELEYRLADPAQRIRAFHSDPAEADGGVLYYSHRSFTRPDQLFPEDVAPALLLNAAYNISFAKRMISSLARLDPPISLTRIPIKPLEQTSSAERQKLAELITSVASLPYIKASVATKILHKKRPSLIPVLDNQAIFGAYYWRPWPQEPARADSISDQGPIREVLDWIYRDLTRSENQPVWQVLALEFPEWTRIELFDMLWWTHFKEIRAMSVGRGAK